MIGSLIWIASTVLVGTLQLLLVTYTAVVCSLELAGVQAIKYVRVSARMMVWPWQCARRSAQRRIAQLMQAMRGSHTYDEWLLAARELDTLEGCDAWRTSRDTDEFDAVLVEETTRRLRRARKGKDVMALLFAVRSVMDRQYGGVDRASLYSHSRTHAHAIIEAFVAEVCAGLEAIAGSDALTPEAKHEFLEACRLNIGRTALALSGGGALAMAHMGVVRTLIHAGLLPRVISGTSGGSIVAAMMAMHTDSELLADILTPRIVNSRHVRFFEPLPVQLWRFVSSTVRLGAPRMVDSEKFAEAVKAYFGETTFGEAYARTGRIVNITVTVSYSGGAAGGSRPLVLNYLTAPACLLWSAVAASCALPGLMRPVTLLAKDYAGNVVPFHPVAGMHSMDGSMASDIPAEQLALMFHVNRTIVSQANPHISPFLREMQPRHLQDGGLLSRALHAIELWLEMDVKQRTKYLARMKMLPKFFGAEFNAVFLQRYSGDVTIAPYQNYLAPWQALSQPTESDMEAFIIAGQRATWPHLAHIRTLVAIEKKLSTCARRFRGAQRSITSPWGQRSTRAHGSMLGLGVPRSASRRTTGNSETFGEVRHMQSRSAFDNRVESFAAPVGGSMLSAYHLSTQGEQLHGDPPSEMHEIGPELLQESSSLAAAGSTVPRTPRTTPPEQLHIRAPSGSATGILSTLPSASSFSDIAALGSGLGSLLPPTTRAMSGLHGGAVRASPESVRTPPNTGGLHSVMGSPHWDASQASLRYTAPGSPSSVRSVRDSASFGSLSPSDMMVAAGTRRAAFPELATSESVESLQLDTSHASFMPHSNSGLMFDSRRVHTPDDEVEAARQVSGQLYTDSDEEQVAETGGYAHGTIAEESTPAPQAVHATDIAVGLDMDEHADVADVAPGASSADDTPPPPPAQRLTSKPLASIHLAAILGADAMPRGAMTPPMRVPAGQPHGGEFFLDASGAERAAPNRQARVRFRPSRMSDAADVPAVSAATEDPTAGH